MRLNIWKYRKWRRIDKWLQTFIISIAIIICVDLLTAQTITTLVFGILRVDSNITITSGQVRYPDGTQSAPPITSSSNTGTGIFFEAGGSQMSFSTAGSRRAYFDTSGSFLPNSINFGGGGGIMTNGVPANSIALKNGNNDMIQQWFGANGAYFQIATQGELLTIAAAAFTDTTMSIPANAIVRGVAVYVVTVIPTAATFTVTGATSATVFNTAAVSTAAGSNDRGSLNTPYNNVASQKVRITPNLVPGAATGQVRIVLMYEIPSPPTS